MVEKCVFNFLKIRFYSFYINDNSVSIFLLLCTFFFYCLGDICVVNSSPIDPNFLVAYDNYNCKE